MSQREGDLMCLCEVVDVDRGRATRPVGVTTALSCMSLQRSAALVGWGAHW